MPVGTAYRAIARLPRQVPVGTIVAWSGPINQIPPGWALCDGQDGRPDLRGRFIVGAGLSYQVGDSGGADAVSLTPEQLPAHSHSVGAIGSVGNHTHTYVEPISLSTGYTGRSGGGSRVGSIGSSSFEVGGGHSHPLSVGNAGGGKPHENRPPFYALAFIIKI